jgi:ATP-binding cassette subfamily F protein 3
VQSRIKSLAKHERLDKLEHIATLDFAFKSEPFPAKVMTRIDHVSFGYDKGPDLFSDLRLEIHDHDRICVIGPNGKGKSTLLRVLAGQLKPRSGEITNHSRTVAGYFAQTNVHTLHDKHTVIQEIQQASRTCLPQTARDIAGVMMFEGDAGLKKVSVLSGGEKSRVMLGKLIVTPVNLLLLDEPTNHLDMDSCDSLLAAIDAFEGAVVIVTHNEMFLHTLATRFIVFDRGRARVFDGSYQDFLDTVGWEDDDDEGPTVHRKNVVTTVDVTPAKPARHPKPVAHTKPAAAPTDRKHERQARAKFVQDRARVLGPLEKRVADLEALIVTLERDRDVAFAALAEASAQGDHAAIAKLSRKSGEIGPRIDWAYTELEKVTGELETAAREFDNRTNGPS